MKIMDNYFGENSLMYCRFCLNNISDNEYFKLKNIVNKYKEVTKLFPELVFESHMEDECFSLCICESCNEKLENTINFFKMVMKNDQQLKNFLECYKLKKIKLEPEIQIKEELNDSFELVTVLLKQESHEMSVIIPATEESENEAPLYTCDICSSKFTSKKSLKKHMTTHKCSQNISIDISKFLICELCTPTPNFPTFDEMTQHYQDIHQIRGYASCCERKFMIKNSFIKHQEMHSNPSKFTCNICLNTYSSIKYLKLHMIRHKPESEKKYECDLCPKKYHFEKELRQHVKMFHLGQTKEQVKIQCPDCDRILCNKYMLKRHAYAVHNISEINWEMCDRCGYKGKTKRDLMSHVRHKHTEVALTECEICGSRVKDIKNHVRLTHSDTLHKCQLCDHVTKNIKSMRLHMAKHSDVKRFVCTVCNLGFKRKIALNDHMSKHDGIPRYFCNYCDRSFNNSGNKFKHIKQVHAKEAAEAKKNQNHAKTEVGSN